LGRSQFDVHPAQITNYDWKFKGKGLMIMVTSQAKYKKIVRTLPLLYRSIHLSIGGFQLILRVGIFIIDGTDTKR